MMESMNDFTKRKVAEAIPVKMEERLDWMIQTLSLLPETYEKLLRLVIYDITPYMDVLLEEAPPLIIPPAHGKLALTEP